MGYFIAGEMSMVSPDVFFFKCLSYRICSQALQLQRTFSAVIIKRLSTRHVLKPQGTLSGYRFVDQLQVSLAVSLNQ